MANSRWRVLPLAALLGGVLLLAGALPASAAKPTQVKGFNFSSTTYSATQWVDSSTTITVTRYPITNKSATVNLATGGGTATAGVDYTSYSGTLTFPANSGSLDVPITILNDTQAGEGDETVTLTLSNPSKGNRIATGIATLTIHREPAAPAPSATVSVPDLSGYPGVPDTGRIRVAWTSGGGSTYGALKVYRSLNATTWGLIYTPPNSSIVTYGDTSFTPGVQYYYRVAAFNHQGLETDSTTQSIRGPEMIPNGGFAFGDFSYWTVTAGVGSVEVTTSTHVTGTDDNHAAVLDSTGAEATGDISLSRSVTAPFIPSSWSLEKYFWYAAIVSGSDTIDVTLDDVTGGGDTNVYTLHVASTVSAWTRVYLPTLQSSHDYQFTAVLHVNSVPSTTNFFLDDLRASYS